MLCDEYPLRERFRAQHMLALYRSGRQAEALRAYQKTRAYLADELGLEPSPELQELERLILNQDRSLLPDTEPQVQTRAFLLTDVEDSTVLWELHTEAMRAAMAEHDAWCWVLWRRPAGRSSSVSATASTSPLPTPAAAVSAAQAIQIELSQVDWRETGPLRVRIAIDAGEVEARGGDYFGPVLNRAGRLLAAAHGGQVLLSGEAHGLSSARSGWQAKALGEYRLKGIGAPVTVFQLVVDGLPTDFPPLRIDRPPTVGGAHGLRALGPRLRAARAGRRGRLRRRLPRLPALGRAARWRSRSSARSWPTRPAFIRRFEAEAQLVAQLEHPHVVPLYDYWREPDGAYLVMRWLRGGSLRQALDRGPWTLEAASRLLAQVGSALADAHRQGVVHRDLKPANVLLDEEGNAYLSDFGIAARLSDPDDRGASSAARPRTCRPRRSRASAHTAALGPLRAGPAHLRAPHRRAAADGRAAAAARSDAPRPAGRARRRDRARHGARPGRAVRVRGRVPRRVRARPGSRHAGARRDVHGRREPVQGPQSLRRERRGATSSAATRSSTSSWPRSRAHRLVAVVGPSGIGKSSAVKAGLVPALRNGALPGSARWLVADLFPGAYPFEELAAALLRVAVERPDDLVEELARDELGIRRVAKRILPAGQRAAAGRRPVRGALHAHDRRGGAPPLPRRADRARRRPAAPVRVVVTLRADFLDHPLRYPEFGELLGAGMVTVAAPSEDELAEAIERPGGDRRRPLRAGPRLARSSPTCTTSPARCRCCSTP